MDNSDWIASWHRIAEVMEVRVSDVQAYRDYIKTSEFETSFFLAEKYSIDSTRSNYSIDLTRSKYSIDSTK